ncbi:MAG TPA: FkbM family methyltransferase [Thermoanaerobaculia bacterium]|nr:FkbM family methyltransferase [Thermoanaerobaculia bacterium]
MMGFLQRAARFAARAAGHAGQEARLAAARRYLRLRPGSIAKVGPYRVRTNDGPNLYILYKDLFVRRLYDFQAERDDPRILDCGSNIGLSILYFKSRYPAARIEAFEPDPSIVPYLRENLTMNAIAGVNVHEAAVGGSEGVLTFYSDHKYGSALASVAVDAERESWTRYDVPCVRFRDLLDQPADLIKMNIEGAEYEAIAGAADRLRQARELLIEYHHLPGLPRTLHDILAILHRNGFEYLLYDFDRETNPAAQPPFHLSPETRLFLLIYARRIGHQ